MIKMNKTARCVSDGHSLLKKYVAVFWSAAFTPLHQICAEAG
jgi:hypothetical protein